MRSNKYTEISQFYCMLINTHTHSSYLLCLTELNMPLYINYKTFLVYLFLGILCFVSLNNFSYVFELLIIIIIITTTYFLNS